MKQLIMNLAEGSAKPIANGILPNGASGGHPLIGGDKHPAFILEADLCGLFSRELIEK